jgi:uncharacterized RDD family membrane protein YckC
MKIKCPACSKVLTIPDTAAGKVVKCPCGKQLRAPGGSATAAAKRPAAAQFDAGFFDELTDTDLQPVKAVAKPGRAEVRDHSTGAKLLNQYSPGASGGAKASRMPQQPIGEMRLATPGSRILATLVDTAFYMVAAGIGIGLSVAVAAIFGGGQPQGERPGLAVAMMVIYGGSIFLAYVYNVFMIAKLGQTLGKRSMGIRMVNKETGVPASFLDGFLISYGHSTVGCLRRPCRSCFSIPGRSRNTP